MEGNIIDTDAMEQNCQKELVFKIGDESKPTVLNESDYKHSPFFNAIDKGLKLAENFISHFKRNEDLSNQNPISSENSNKLYANNIISFLGERGSGKTSCILSVSEILKERYNLKDRDKNILEFFDIIDPSFFDKKHNIIQIFLGEFYRNFQKLSGDYCNLTNDDRDKLKRLQSEFKNVSNAIKFLDEKKSDEYTDEISDLSYLSSGVELSRSLERLISNYLEYKKKDLLVIAIDDIDLNVVSSYVMMEQIRKYLILPNVIILLGAKLRQLKDGIINNLHDYKSRTHVTDSDLSRMADNYLVKFLPTNQRVYMPEATDFLKLNLTIKGEKGIIAGNATDETILAIIFRKTRFLFYNYADESSLIIPRNLRSLRMFATMLYSMDNPDSIDIHNANKEVFKKYITEQWVPTYIPEYIDFVLELINEQNVALINKRIVDFIIENSKNLREWKDYEDASFSSDSGSERKRIILREITNPANSNVNISIGDVSFVMRLSNNLEEDNKLSNLFFFIMTFYSIRLYELYDKITSDKALGDNGFIEKEDSVTTIPLLKKDVGVDIPDYFKLVGGSFFTLTGDTLIPLNPYGESREIKLIDAKYIFDEIGKIIELSKGTTKKQPNFILRLRIIEFFIICSVRNIELKKGRDSYNWRVRDNYRANVDPKFLNVFPNSTKNVIFSPIAPFFNLIYPKWAYERYHKDLFEIALNCSDSLLNKFLTTKRYDNRYHDLMSRICIRNMEVRDDLERWLESRNKGLRPNENGDFGILKDFFSKFRGGRGSYSIKTYDKESDKESYHTIQFDPIGVLYEEVFNTIDSIKDDNEKEDLLSLFYNIYSPSDKLEFNRSYPLSLIREIISSSGIAGSNMLLDYIENMSKIHKEETINTIGLVKYLASFPLLNPNLAKTIFDKELIAGYVSEYQDRLEQRVVIADKSLKEVMNQLVAVKKESRELFKEHDRLLKNANAVQDELSKISDEKMDLLMKINQLSARRSELEEEYDKVKGENSSKLQVFNPKDNKEMRDLTISITQAMSHMEKMDNLLIPEKKKESTRLLKELDNISSQMDELSQQESSLQNKQRNLTFQLDEAQARLTQALKDLKGYK